jgi:hypothetical protein
MAAPKIKRKTSFEVRLSATQTSVLSQVQSPLAVAW